MSKQLCIGSILDTSFFARCCQLLREAHVLVHTCKSRHWRGDSSEVEGESEVERASFSASPCHLEVRVEAEMLKKVACASDASALASSVLPLPGGPYSSSPRAGARSPWNRSARCAGRITISCSACAAQKVLPSHPSFLTICRI